MIKEQTIRNLRYSIDLQHSANHLPYLVMLHGFMGDHRVFDHLYSNLSDFCNILAVDLLGHGKSAPSINKESYNESQQINDLLQLLESNHIESPYLYGYSMGGRLALKIALAHTELFKGLILESANCGITDPQDRNQRRKTDRERAREITRDFDHFLKEWQQLPLFKSPYPVDKQLRDKYISIQQSQNPEALAASLKGFGTGTMLPCCNKLEGLNIPVLLLSGSADQKYQRINTQLARKLPNAHFPSIKAGHRVHIDHPAALIKHLDTFMNK